MRAGAAVARARLAARPGLQTQAKTRARPVGVQAKAARRPVQLAAFQALAPLPLVAAGTLAVRCQQLAALLRQTIPVSRLVRAAKLPQALELAVRLDQAARVERLPEQAAQRAARLEVQQPATKPSRVQEPADN